MGVNFLLSPHFSFWGLFECQIQSTQTGDNHIPETSQHRGYAHLRPVFCIHQTLELGCMNEDVIHSGYYVLLYNLHIT